MQNEQDSGKDSLSIPIGKEINIFRTLINCTQEKLANRLLVSRATISKAEQANHVSELNSDIIFRLCWETQCVIDNENKEDYVRQRAKILQSRIRASLETRRNAYLQEK